MSRIEAHPDKEQFERSLHSTLPHLGTWQIYVFVAFESTEEVAVYMHTAEHVPGRAKRLASSSSTLNTLSQTASAHFQTSSRTSKTTSFLFQYLNHIVVHSFSENFVI